MGTVIPCLALEETLRGGLCSMINMASNESFVPLVGALRLPILSDSPTDFNSPSFLTGAHLTMTEHCYHYPQPTPGFP